MKVRPPWMQRLAAKWWLWRNVSDELSRRVQVERELGEVYRGLRELPDKEQCLKWAQILGIPGRGE